jgi:predicted amidohydrolase
VTVKLPDVVKVAVVISSDIKFPETVKLFAIVTSLGRPTVIVCPLAEVSTSFAVPVTVND